MIAVAIDGPAGAGKSSVARAVAEALGFSYLDTGAMYRAVAWAALQQGIDTDDEDALGHLMQRLPIELEGETVRVGGRDVTSLLRARDVTATAARVAQHRAVREALVALQRKMAAGRNVVMEGRDIGTQVLPDAQAKVFLTASLDERALRRCKQLRRPEDPATLHEIRSDIERRDHRDSHRAVSPLVQAPDATVVDTTGIPLEEVVQRIAEIVRRAKGVAR